jgi:hypothetical protein
VVPVKSDVFVILKAFPAETLIGAFYASFTFIKLLIAANTLKILFRGRLLIKVVEMALSVCHGVVCPIHIKGH